LRHVTGISNVSITSEKITMIPPVITQGGAKEVADLARDAGNSLTVLTPQILETYLPQLRFWAANNLYRLKDKLEEENAKRQHAGKTLIPTRFALPALARIAEEDDDDMLTIWARLFANLQDPERQIVPNKVYIHVLSGMEPLDAELLRHIVVVLSGRQAAYSPATGEVVGMTGTAVDHLVSDLGASQEQIMLSLHNLARLGCFRGEQNTSYLVVEPTPVAVSPWTQGWPWIAATEASFPLTSLGYAIVQACRGADQPKPA
jgi:hypothetical protein